MPSNEEEDAMKLALEVVVGRQKGGGVNETGAGLVTFREKSGTEEGRVTTTLGADSAMVVATSADDALATEVGKLNLYMGYPQEGEVELLVLVGLSPLVGVAVVAIDGNIRLSGED